MTGVLAAMLTARTAGKTFADRFGHRRFLFCAGAGHRVLPEEPLQYRAKIFFWPGGK